MKFLLWFFFFFFCVVAGLAASSDPLPAIFQEAQRWFGPIRRKVLDGILKGPSYKILDPALKDTLMRGDISSLPPIVDGQINGEIWDALGAGPILSLTPPSRIANLLQHSKVASTSLAKQLRDILHANVSTTSAVQKLANLTATTEEPTYLKQLLLHRLGPPEGWVARNISNMSAILFDLPSDLLTRVADADAIQELDSQVLKCLLSSANKSSSCPQVSSSGDDSASTWLNGLHSFFTVQRVGDPKTWTKTTLTQVDIKTIPSLLVQVPNDVLLSWKTNVVNLLNNNSNQRRLIGRAVVRKFLRAEAVQQMTDVQQVETFLGSLGSYLGSFVYPEDLPPVALAKPAIKVNMETNTGLAARSGTLEAKSVESMVQRFAQDDPLNAYQARTMGLAKLSMAPPLVLANTFAGMRPSMEELIYLVLFIQMNGGPTVGGKLRLMADTIFEMARGDDGALNWDSVPPPIMDLLPLEEFSKVGVAQAVAILGSLPPNLKPAQVRILLSKLDTTQKAATSPQAKTFLSMAEARQILKAGGNDTLSKLVASMPASSTLGKLATAEAFYVDRAIQTLSDDLFTYIDEFGVGRAIDQFPGPLMGLVQNLTNTQLSLEACSRLQQALVDEFAFYANGQPPLSPDEVFSLLTATDVELLPPCVVAGLGNANMAAMSDDMKVLLLEKVQAMGQGAFNATGMEAMATQTAVANGIKVIGTPPGGLTGAGVQEFKETLLLAPPDVIKGVREDATGPALKIFNDLASTPLMPCLDSDRRGAIRTLIFRNLGSLPTEWTSVSSVCCLLYTLTSSDLSSIPRGALTTCTCETKDTQLYSILTQERKVFCRDRLGSDYRAEVAAKAAVVKAQTRAAITLLDPATFSKDGRRKRAISDEPACDRAAISGVESFSLSELEALPLGVLQECLANFGSRYMEDDKAEVLANKVPQSLNPSWYSSLSVKNLTDMGHILRGIAMADIPGMPAFTYPAFNDVVLALGDPAMKFSNELLKAYARKVLKEWKSPVSSWTSIEILTANRLLCGLNGSDLMDLNASSFGEALPVLGFSLEGCEVKDTLATLALKVEQTYGPNDNWTVATVQEMGVIFAGVSPEKIMGLRPQIMSGVTPAAAGYMPRDTVHAMTYTHLSSMRLATLRSLTPDPGNLDYQYALLNRLQDSGFSTVTFHALLLWLACALALRQ